MSWGKPKWVHLDVICIIHTVVFLSVQSIWNFLKLGGIWKRKKKKKKRHTQAFQFLQLVVHMYFVPVKLFILEIKEKKSILEKKNCLASQCGLALTGSWVWPLWWCQAIFFLFIYFFFRVCFCFFVSKRCLILILLHVPHFVSRFQFRGGWDPLNRGKFHVSIRAVHIV